MTKSSPGRVQSLAALTGVDEALNRFQKYLLARLKPILANTVLAMADWRICEDGNRNFLIQRRIGVNRWETAWAIVAAPNPTANTTNVNNITNSYVTGGGASTPWADLSLGAGFSDFRLTAEFPLYFGSAALSTYPPPQYRRDASGRVYLRGMISGDSVSGPWSGTMFTLPIGFRPVGYSVVLYSVASLPGFIGGGNLAIDTEGRCADAAQGLLYSGPWNLEQTSFWAVP